MTKTIKNLLLLVLALCYASEQVRGLPQNKNDYDYDADDAGDDDVDDTEGEPPKMLSASQTFEVNLGTTVKLPCKVDRMEEAVLQWRKKDSPLFMSNMKQTGEVRYSVDPKDFTLIIINAQSSDENEYFCQILGEDPTQVVRHVVSVRSGPMIRRIVPEKEVTEEKAGSPFTFMCEATGKTPPKVYWLRKNNVNESRKVESDHFHYDKLTWRHSGNYTCFAQGSDGLTNQRTVVLQVKAAPDIDVPATVVNSAEKYESEIVCNVYCIKCTPVVWEKDGVKIKPETRHYTVLTEGDRRILRISATKKNDFGQYTCISTNAYGSANKTVVLRGEPLKPTIESLKMSADNLPILTWKIISKAEVQKYEIIYKRQQDDDWSSFNPEVKPGNNGVYMLTHTFADLLPETYMAKLRVKNEYGFSELSDEVPFSGDFNEDADATHSMLAPAPVSDSAQHLELRITALFVICLWIPQYLR